MIAVSFWLFLLFAASAIVIAGRTLERSFLAVIAVSVIITFALNAWLGWLDAQPFILLVDAALLATSLVLTNQTTSYWPIWFSAFQAIAVATATANRFFPHQLPPIYIALQGFWFLPALASMTIGTVLDWRMATLDTLSRK